MWTQTETFLTLLSAIVIASGLVRCDYPQTYDYLMFIGEDTDYDPEINYVAKLIEQQPSKDPNEIMDFLTNLARDVREMIATGKSTAMNHNPARILQLNHYLDQLLLLKPSHENCATGTCSPSCSYVDQRLTFETIRVRFDGIPKFLSYYRRNATPSDDRKLYNLLSHFMTEQIKMCQSTLSDRFWQAYSKENMQAEALFDEMMSPKGTTDEKLESLAYDVDLTDQDLNVSRMLSALKKSKIIPSDDKHKGDMLIASMMENCKHLTNGLESMFETFNIAESLDLHIEVLYGFHKNPSKFRKLNEYFRLCTQLTNHKTGQLVEENIHRRFSVKYKALNAKNKIVDFALGLRKKEEPVDDVVMW